MPFSYRVVDVNTQQEALIHLARLADKSITHPLIVETAKSIIRDCASREDECELEAIFNAVKHGDPRITGLKKGFKYIADARAIDGFTAPYRSLVQCSRGACGGDCDDHASLIAALAGAIGFKVGLRAWGEEGEEFSHVYAVIGLPKRNPSHAVGMDTTVDESSVGWEPPRGRVLTAWLEPEE